MAEGEGGEKLEYSGKVYLYSSGMPDDLVELSKEKLAERGVKLEDIVLLLDPVGAPEGSIMATIWPHYLSVARVKRVREGSIYAPQLFNIQF
ncbi:hypothetical protein [Nitrososphaera sp.]|uniref:hypothetical protein n=1 Tax=Nitrososphaera sp. TaxID=1971748 RepID=UPI00307D8388